MCSPWGLDCACPFGAVVLCLEDGDLLGVKLCCSLPVHALGGEVSRGGKILFASKKCSLQGGSLSCCPQGAKAPPGEVWGPSLVPLE